MHQILPMMTMVVVMMSVSMVMAIMVPVVVVAPVSGLDSVDAGVGKAAVALGLLVVQLDVVGGKLAQADPLAVAVDVLEEVSLGHGQGQEGRGRSAQYQQELRM